MSKQEWIPIKIAKEGTPSVKTVTRSGIAPLKGVALKTTQRGSTVVRYDLGGAWKGAFSFGQARYDTLSVPRAAASTDQGLPQIPQEGIFVAVPTGATNLGVKVVGKKMRQLSGKWHLKPAPKPITEEEYLAGKEEYRPRPEVYNSDGDYPGKDFELLGLRSMEGVPVVHLIIYLAQYKPKSGTLSIVESITIEVGYDVPPQTDAVPKANVVPRRLRDMILDSDNVQMQMYTSSTIARMVAAVSAASILRIYSDYVIIAPDTLVSSVAPLKQAKSATVVSTSRIVADFPAASLEQSIKAFLSYAWNNWIVKPRFVVLAGDIDTIPTHYTNVGGANFASDHWYADILGDLCPEIAVSRIPTSDPAIMQQICQHLADYPNHRTPDQAGWQKEVVLVAYQGLTYKQCSDEIATNILQHAPRFNVTKLYGDSSTRQQVVNKMNTGVLVANYRGHGSKTEWSSANGLRTQEIHALNNDNMPPMVFCICCQNAWVDDQATEVVAESFLRNGKCVALIGASRNSPTYANNDFNKYLWTSIMDSGEVTPADIFKLAKTLMIQNYNDDYHNQDVVMYSLYGDPTAAVTST